MMDIYTPEIEPTLEEKNALAEARLQDTIRRINEGRTANQMAAKIGLPPIKGISGPKLGY